MALDQRQSILHELQVTNPLQLNPILCVQNMGIMTNVKKDFAVRSRVEDASLTGAVVSSRGECLVCKAVDVYKEQTSTMFWPVAQHDRQEVELAVCTETIWLDVDVE